MANEKIFSMAFIKKYKWWLIGGLGIGLVVFLYAMNRQQSSSTAATSSADTGANAIDPNTGQTYASELAAAQQAAAAGSATPAYSYTPSYTNGTTTNGSSTGTTSGASTGTPSTSTTSPATTSTGTPATASGTGPATATATSNVNVNLSIPGTPAPAKQPATQTAPKPVTKAPAVIATLLPSSLSPPVKRAGYPVTATAKATAKL